MKTFDGMELGMESGMDAMLKVVMVRWMSKVIDEGLDGSGRRTLLRLVK